MSPDFSHTRLWWPDSLADEMMPDGRASPEAWLAPDLAGVTAIYWEDDGKLIDTLSPGETVEFLWHEKRGTVTIRVMPDGTWSLDAARCPRTADMFAGDPAPAAPAADIASANWFADPSDYETMTHTMDEFAANHAAYAGPLDPAGNDVTVEMGFWSDTVRFVVSADGKSLEPVRASDA